MALIPISRRTDSPLPPDTVDVRGWTVRTQLDDSKVGKVDDMVVDTDGRTRFLDVDLGVFDRHVLVPVHRSHPAVDDEVVWVEGMTRDDMNHIPEYAQDVETLTPAYERRLEEAWDRTPGQPRAVEPTRMEQVTDTGAVETRYARLGALDEYRVASADSDPRGWAVLAGDGRRIGEVKELIVDTASMAARYLDCDIDEKELELEPIDRHVLIPVRRTRLDADRRRVIVDGVFSEDVVRYPVYSGLPLARDYEDKLNAVFGPYDERSRGTSETGAGDAVEKQVHVRQDDRDVLIRLSGDDVIIEKRPRT